MKREVDDIVQSLKKLLKPVVEDECTADDIDLNLWDEIGISLEKVIFDSENRNLVIITPDRPEKSAVIGKGGWVVGRLREELGVNSIHVEANSDILVRKYRMELASKRLAEILPSFNEDDKYPLENLQDLLNQRIENVYFANSLLKGILNDSEKPKKESQTHRAIVALSGGVDSSSSLIIAKILGFNPIAVTVNPGEIVLPKHFQKNVENLSKLLDVEHEYINVDMSSVIENALEGKIHPCGRCSGTIEEALMDHTKQLKISFLIFGDFLSTGAQSILFKEGVWRINMPAMLSATKGETKGLAGRYGIKSAGGYGCPLINEVHKRHAHMSRFSIQRVLRETRAGVLEPGEALGLIMRSI
ncbi:ATPase [Methanobacterium paludis]|uniref:tRNA methyl transferase-like protein n=1 Tax=Methanobacterium paludis (strain DSM 25820 / JCM 18151 / SWAN1) TaxID=868131 RepID=F6D3X8_METPW|nr:ATPase [Methanobacterium paludis]AEG18780.1 tRNA methyl transferase-like protein [Methanobacterium paludis]